MRRILLTVSAFLAMILSCSQKPLSEPGAPLSCEQPAFLQPGDKIALISPSFFTSKENVEAASRILREWGFEPVVGPNVGKEYLGAYAGTLKERIADLEDDRFALEGL